MVTGDLPIAIQSHGGTTFARVRSNSTKLLRTGQKASTIYISTDYDREGEAIARSLLDRFRYSGPIRRVCLTALDESSIKKALNNVKDGKDTVSLYHAALATATR